MIEDINRAGVKKNDEYFKRMGIKSNLNPRLPCVFLSFRPCFAACITPSREPPLLNLLSILFHFTAVLRYRGLTAHSVLCYRVEMGIEPRRLPLRAR